MAQKLLLADDSVTIQRVIELTFADENIEVIAVGDGDQAIARINSDPPDIVLADIGMPGRDGYEVSAFIKHTPKLAHIPVLLLTGAFEPVDQSRAAEVGSDGVLAKPFEPQLVISRVKELLSRPAERTVSLDADLAAPPATPGPSTEHLDDYFDRLDAAFANLSSQPPPPAPEPKDAPDIDWFTTSPTAPAAEPADVPMSYASPEPPVDVRPADERDEAPSGPLEGATFASPAAPATPFAPSAAPASTAPAESAAPVASAAAPPLPPVAPEAVPSLGDAFAAILAAEQDDADGAPIAWPSAASATPPVAGGDALVEQVTERVLERLSDRVVRDAVSTIVSEVAERLVREEIERIKASLR